MIEKHQRIELHDIFNSSVTDAQIGDYFDLAASRYCMLYTNGATTQNLDDCSE